MHLAQPIRVHTRLLKYAHIQPTAPKLSSHNGLGSPKMICPYSQHVFLRTQTRCRYKTLEILFWVVEYLRVQKFTWDVFMVVLLPICASKGYIEFELKSIIVF